MNDRARPATESENSNALLQWRIAKLEADYVELETKHAQLNEKVSGLINRGLGIGLAISFLGMLVGYFLSFFKNIKLG